MIKNITVLIVLVIRLIFITISISAQDTPDAYKNRVNYIFANVDHSKVTTGLLSDYGLQVIPPEAYDGILRDTNEVDIDIFHTLYGDMDYSRFNSNCALSGQSTVVSAIASNLPAEGQPIPIASMLISYNSYRTDAYTSGKVTVVNEQIFDVTGQNPYQTNLLFAASPIKMGFNSSTLQFVLKSSLYYSNAGKTISSMAVDMGDGVGFKNVLWDVPFSISYSSTGNKRFIIKYSFSDGTVLQTHGKIAVDFTLELKSAKDYYFSTALIHNIDAASGHSGGTVTVRFGLGHADGKLRKPLIVAEGFDAWKIISPNNPTKNLTIDDFLKFDYLGKSFGRLGVPLNSSLYDLESSLYSQAYDIVYLDYNDGTDDIKRNAVLLEEAIKWVNVQKQANGSTEPNVVMGISMGGLVARYALRHLETQGYNHQAKVYISMDSPHRGANVPVGVQAALYHAKNFGFTIGLLGGIAGYTIHPAEYFDIFKRFYSLLNTTAAKQMLIYRVISSSGSLTYDNSVHQSFMNEYDSMGYPQLCSNVAISDGSGTANPLFSAGTTLIDYSASYSLKSWMEVISVFMGTALLFTNYPELSVLAVFPGSTQIKLEVTINAIPVTQGRVYHSRIYVKKKVLWLIPVQVDITNVNFNSTSSMYPVDGAPGGIYDLDAFADVSAFPAGSLKQTRFCFVPAVSALALKNWPTYYNSSLNNFDFVSNGETGFQDYYKSMPTTNNFHTSFYTSNYSMANFIKSTLDNINPSCTTTTIVQNMNYTNNHSITGCNLDITNVIIQNNSTIIFDAKYKTNINGPFEVKLGSTVEIK